MTQCLQRWTTTIALLLACTTRFCLAEEPIQSQISGCWSLVDGVERVLGEERALPPDRDAPSLIVKPDGSFYYLRNVLSPQLLGQLRNVGDSCAISSDRPHYSVVASAYAPDRSELRIMERDIHKDTAYLVHVIATLQVDGSLGLFLETPFSPGSTSIVTAHMRRSEQDPPWAWKDLAYELTWHSDGVCKLAQSADGRHLLSAGCAAGTLRLWDIANEREVRHFVGHTGPVSAIALSTDGGLAASGGGGDLRYKDESLRIWQVGTGEQVFCNNRFAYITALEFLPHSRTLIVAGIERLWDLDSVTVALFDCVSKQWTKDLVFGRLVSSIACSPDGHLFCASPESVVESQLPGGQELQRFDTRAFVNQPHLLLQPSTLRLFAIGSEPHLVYLNSTTREVSQTFAVDTIAPTSAAFSPDGRHLITAGRSDNRLTVWDVATGKAIYVLPGHHATVTDLRVSPNGLYAISCSLDGSIRVWRLHK